MLAHKRCTKAGAPWKPSPDTSRFEPNAIPAVVSPIRNRVAGLTETQAKDRDADHGRQVPWRLGRAITLDRPKSHKLLIDRRRSACSARYRGLVRRTDCRRGAGDRNVRAGGRCRMTIHPHPTLSETMMEARKFLRQATDIIVRRNKRRCRTRSAGPSTSLRADSRARPVLHMRLLILQ